MKLLFFMSLSFISISTSAMEGVDNVEANSGYRCFYTVSRGGEREPRTGSCEDHSLSRARQMMFRQAAEVRGEPGACYPAQHVVSGCN